MSKQFILQLDPRDGNNVHAFRSPKLQSWQHRSDLCSKLVNCQIHSSSRLSRLPRWKTPFVISPWKGCVFIGGRLPDHASTVFGTYKPIKSFFHGWLLAGFTHCMEEYDRRNEGRRSRGSQRLLLPKIRILTRSHFRLMKVSAGNNEDRWGSWLSPAPNEWKSAHRPLLQNHRRFYTLVWLWVLKLNSNWWGRG